MKAPFLLYSFGKRIERKKECKKIAKKRKKTIGQKPNAGIEPLRYYKDEKAILCVGKKVLFRLYKL
jgi:hypothetical protein